MCESAPLRFELEYDRANFGNAADELEYDRDRWKARAMEIDHNINDTLDNIRGYLYAIRSALDSLYYQPPEGEYLYMNRILYAVTDAIGLLDRTDHGGYE
jgi:hypothetical protein